MGIIIPKTLEVTKWKGLHLFHAGMSNCSQRVRMMLEEKQLPWISHEMNMAKDENLSDWYQGINPNGVVPTLIHDGTVIIESTDILEYLDQQFSGPAATPSFMQGEGLDSEHLHSLITLVNDTQIHLKTLSFEYLFKPMAKKNPRQLETLKQKLRNQDLLKFHQQFSSKQGLGDKRVSHSVVSMHLALQQLEQYLGKNNWLAGERFSIADMAWIVNVHRLGLMHFPLGAYPKLSHWFSRMQQRPSYQQALVQYEPKPALLIVRLYAWFRANFGASSFKQAQLMPNNL